MSLVPIRIVSVNGRLFRKDKFVDLVGQEITISLSDIDIKGTITSAGTSETNKSATLMVETVYPLEPS